MTSAASDASLQHTARFAGLLYLVIVATGIFSEFFVRAQLVVPGDAAVTAANIAASEALFRLGIAGDVVMVACDVLVAWAFYVLLKDVGENLALLSAFLRLVMAAVLALNLMSHFEALALLDSVGVATTLPTPERQTLALLALEGHAKGYDLALVFFGLALIPLASLLWRSRYVPRVLAILIALAGVTYVAGSFTVFLSPQLAAAVGSVYVVPFIAETALALWLLIRGVNTRRADA